MQNYLLQWFDSALLAISNVWILLAFFFLFRRPGQHQRGKSNSVFLETQPVKNQRFIENEIDSGSFYLKMGATLFAIGSMIYSCLQLGVFVENTLCFNFVMGVNPCLFILFTMLQLYFIFKNSQVSYVKTLLVLMTSNHVLP